MTTMYVAHVRVAKNRDVEIVATDRALLDTLVNALTPEGVVECVIMQMEQRVAPPEDDGDLCQCPQCQQARNQERRH